MVVVTILLYAMRFIVNNRQEPYGCLFLFILWPTRSKYIHGIYCNGGRQVGGSAMDLGAKLVA